MESDWSRQNGAEGEKDSRNDRMTRVEERVWKKKVAVRRFTLLMAFRCQISRGKLGGFYFARI
jgi:hypothetical protein